MLFLTKDELMELTQYKLVAGQIKWLQQHGYPYEIARNGRPVVLRAEVERRLSSQRKIRGARAIPRRPKLNGELDRRIQ